MKASAAAIATGTGSSSSSSSSSSSPNIVLRPNVVYSLVLLCCSAFTVAFIVQTNRIQVRERRATERWESAVIVPHYERSSSTIATPAMGATAVGTTTGSVREIKGRYKPSEHRRDVDGTTTAQQYTHPVALESIIDENSTIIGDPGWLLDFGIIGYGKCGTSTMMIWLLEHPEVQAFGKEMSEFMKQQPGELVRKLYEDLEPGPYKRGYKAPQDITQRHILDYYRTYWPKAKLILGIRHPVWWFESLYNFRVQNLPPRLSLPHPNKLVGACLAKRYGTCTNKGDFALSMMNLGKHNYPQPRDPTRLETHIMSRYRKLQLNFSAVSYMENPVFLFELTQLGDDNETRNEQFRRDVSSFMDLNELLPSIPHAIPGKRRTEREQMKRDEKKISICDDEFAPLREELMELAVTNSLWIRKVFLESPTVFVSSPEHFHDILISWMDDPCETGQRTNSKR